MRAATDNDRSLTVAEMARRWRMSRRGVETLIDAGHVVAFCPPGGKVRRLRVLLSEVVRCEQEWAVAGPPTVEPEREPAISAGVLRYFPDAV